MRRDWIEYLLRAYFGSVLWCFRDKFLKIDWKKLPIIYQKDCTKLIWICRNFPVKTCATYPKKICMKINKYRNVSHRSKSGIENIQLDRVEHLWSLDFRSPSIFDMNTFFYWQNSYLPPIHASSFPMMIIMMVERN